jgi:sec-independent protein translocase protein TatB
MDLGMSELLVIGIVALIVIGPKDLPEMFRQLGRFTAKMRAMAREFSRAMEQAANEAGVADVAKDLKAVTDPKSMGLNAVKDAVDKFEKWDPIKNAAKPTQPQTSSTLVPPPMPATPKPAAAEAVPVAAAPVAPTPVAPTPVAPAPVAPAQVAAEAPAAAAVGPKTAALYEKKAARQAIVQESVAKLKALDAPPVEAKPDPVAAPKAPRKKKAAQE